MKQQAPVFSAFFCILIILFISGNTLAEQKVCIPPQTGLKLSQILDKDLPIPSGWHLGDSKIQKWKIKIFFEPDNNSPQVNIELLPKEIFPGLLQGKWFSFRLTIGKHGKINDKSKSGFLLFAKQVDESFQSNPFENCLMDEPVMQEVADSKTRPIKFPPWLYVLIGAFWILLIPVSILVIFRRGDIH